jgi:hypothetical protein
MAAIAPSNIIPICDQFAAKSISGWPIEMYRIINGFAAGDTATITPKKFRNLKDARCVGAVSDMPVTDAYNSPGPTSVTFTMRFSAAAGSVPTNPIENVDVILTGRMGS